MADDRFYTDKQLLFYNGEKRCPFDENDILSSYWELESVYENQVKNDDAFSDEILQSFGWDFPDLLDDIIYGHLGLKSWLYAQYCHWGGTMQGFPQWLMDYVLAFKSSILVSAYGDAHLAAVV